MNSSLTNAIGYKRLNPEKVVEGVSPFAKTGAVVNDVSKLFKLITIPISYVSSGFVYPRQLLFQINYTFDEDFYILNPNAYKAYASWMLSGGCICIKWRIGRTVYRYKLLDHRTDDWSWFESYTNQRVEKNFCIEFWGNNLNPGMSLWGLMQTMTFQTSSIYDPTEIDETSSIDTLGASINDSSIVLVSPSVTIYPIPGLAHLIFIDVTAGATYHWTPGVNETSFANGIIPGVPIYYTECSFVALYNQVIVIGAAGATYTGSLYLERFSYVAPLENGLAVETSWLDNI